MGPNSTNHIKINSIYNSRIDRSYPIIRLRQNKFNRVDYVRKINIFVHTKKYPNTMGRMHIYLYYHRGLLCSIMLKNVSHTLFIVDISYPTIRVADPGALVGSGTGFQNPVGLLFPKDKVKVGFDKVEIR